MINIFLKAFRKCINLFLQVFFLIFLICLSQRLYAVELGWSLQKVVENNKIKNNDQIKIITQYFNGQILYEVQIENQTYFFINNKLCAFSILHEELPKIKNKNFVELKGIDFFLFKKWYKVNTLSFNENIFIAEEETFVAIFDKLYVEYFIYNNYKKYDVKDSAKIIPFCFFLNKKYFYNNLITFIIEKTAIEQNSPASNLTDQFSLNDFYRLILNIIDDEKSGIFNTLKTSKNDENSLILVSNNLAFNKLNYTGNINNLILTFDSILKKQSDGNGHLSLLSNYIETKLSMPDQIDKMPSKQSHEESKKKYFLADKVGSSNFKNNIILIAPAELEFGLSHLIYDKKYFKKRKKYYDHLYLAPNWSNYPRLISLDYLVGKDNSFFCIILMCYKNKDVYAIYQKIDGMWKLMWFAQELRPNLDEIHWGDI